MKRLLPALLTGFVLLTFFSDLAAQTPRTRAYLWTRYETGDKPTQTDYRDVFATFFSKVEDSLYISQLRGVDTLLTDATLTGATNRQIPTAAAVKTYVDNAISGGVGAVTSVFGRTGGITAGAGDYTASQVTNTPAGDIAATTVQAAINELDSEKLQDTTGSVDADNIATGAVGADELASSGVTLGSYGSDTQIPVITVDADGRITSASNITAASGSSIADGDKTDIDVSSSGSVWTIDSAAVTSLKILDGTIATADIADDAITGAKIADSTIDSTNIATGGIGNTDLQDAIVTSGKIADDAVTLAKQAAGTANRLIGYDGSGNPSEISAGANVTISGGTISTTSVVVADTLDALPAAAAFKAADRMVLTDSTGLFGQLVDQMRDSTIFSAATHADIVKISTTLKVGDRIKVKDTGAEYLVQADSIAGFATDGVAVIEVGANYAVLQPIKGNEYDITHLGCVGDNTTNNSTALQRAFRWQQTGKILFVPTGIYQAGGATFSFTKDVDIRGEGGKNSYFVNMGLLQLDTLDFNLDGVGFIDSPSNYVFRYNTGTFKSDTTYYNVSIKNCWFKNVERAWSLFKSGTDDYKNIFSLKLKDNHFDSLIVGGIMLRSFIKSAEITGNSFRHVADTSQYNFCVNIGDDDSHESTGIIVNNNTFEEIAKVNENLDADVYYIVLAYGDGGIFSNNTFTECQRGLYMRGQDGLISDNTFENRLTNGRLPVIFKGGAGSSYTLTSNVFVGNYMDVVLFDNDADIVNISNNTFLGQLVTSATVTSSSLFSFISTSRIVNFIGNSIKIENAHAAASLAMSPQFDQINIIGNSIYDLGFFLTANNASNGNIFISGNQINTFNCLFIKAKSFISKSNVYFVRKSSSTFIRINDNSTGIYRFKNDDFLLSPDEDWTSSSPFSGNIRLDGDYNTLEFNKCYFQPGNSASTSYWIRNNNNGHLILNENKIDAQNISYSQSYSESGAGKITLKSNDLTSSTGIVRLAFAVPDSTAKMDVVAFDNFSSDGDSIILVGATPADYEFFRNVEFRPGKSTKWSIPSTSDFTTFTKIMWDGEYVDLDAVDIPDLGTTYYKQFGNSFGANATLGTNDVRALNFETSGTRRLTIPSSGIANTPSSTKALVLSPDDSLGYTTLQSSDFTATVTQSGSDTLQNSAQCYGYFERNGNYVDLNVRIEVAFLAAGAANTFYFDPPIASDFTTEKTDVIGRGGLDTQALSSTNIQQQRCLAFASTSDDKIGISVDPPDSLTYPDNRMYITVQLRYVIQ